MLVRLQTPHGGLNPLIPGNGDDCRLPPHPHSNPGLVDEFWGLAAPECCQCTQHNLLQLLAFCLEHRPQIISRSSRPPSTVASFHNKFSAVQCTAIQPDILLEYHITLFPPSFPPLIDFSRSFFTFGLALGCSLIRCPRFHLHWVLSVVSSPTNSSFPDPPRQHTLVQRSLASLPVQILVHRQRHLLFETRLCEPDICVDPH